MIGELHRPTAPRESKRPSWLTIPETGLYTGVLVVGAVGYGKTSACMHPFARQILSWQANRPGRRASALVLEVNGDFCHGVRRILEEAGRGADYLEIGLDGAWQWNPLDDPLLDTYLLAYSVSTLINQLFGKSRDPFWRQAYTNLVRWIIELHRLLPGGWVTLQDIYRCTIDAEFFAERIAEARELAAEACLQEAVISGGDLFAAAQALGEWMWRQPPGEEVATCRLDPALRERLGELGIPFEIKECGGRSRERAQGPSGGDRAVVPERHWTALNAKLRTSIAEGISVFLSLFDQPQVASVFCPPPQGPEEDTYAGSDPRYWYGEAASGRPLPGLRVLLKNAWMQALLLRPAEAARHPGRYLRPAAFICDEYQAFATVGEDDPRGARRRSRSPASAAASRLVATQSISPLCSVLPGTEAWRTLVQTLRTRIFLSLSDESSAKIASKMCGSVMKTVPSYTFTETTGQPEFSLLSECPGGGQGTIGASKSFRRSRKPVFLARAFSLLDNCQAICLPYDGTRSLPARHVYLKPHYLPREADYWRLREEGRL